MLRKGSLEEPTATMKSSHCYYDIKLKQTYALACLASHVL